MRRQGVERFCFLGGRTLQLGAFGREDLYWCLKAETSPRSRVEAFRYRVQILLRVDRQVASLGQILANQAVHVLVRWTLPWRMRVTEVHLHLQSPGKFIVARHLFALVIGQAGAHGRRHFAKLTPEADQRST